MYYDFGMMGTIPTLTRERLSDLFYAVYKKDSDEVTRLLLELQILVPSADLLSVKRSIAFFLERLGQQAERQETVGNIGEDLFAIAVDQPFRFPATFTFVLRAFGTLEGIGAGLDPKFKFVEVAAPYATELLNLKEGDARRQFAVQQLALAVSSASASAAALPGRVQRIDATMAKLEAGDLKLRVRVLDGERADRRSAVMQAATVCLVAASSALNVGVSLAVAGRDVPASAAMGIAAVAAAAAIRNFWRIGRLDEFEKTIKRGASPSSGSGDASVARTR